MERRLLLVFALTFMVLLLMQPILSRFAPKTEPQKAPKTPAAQQAPAGENAPAPAPPSATKAASAKPPAITHATKQAESEAQTVIENGLYRITFTNQGAKVTSWVLKKYSDDHGNPLELVHKTAASQYGYPLSLWTYDEGLRNQLNSALYVVSGGNASSSQAAGATLSAPAEVVFEYADQDIEVRKRFRFDHSYAVQVETHVTRGGQTVPALPAWPAGFGDQTAPPSYAAMQVGYEYGGKIERLSAKKVSGGNTLRTPYAWGGVYDQYFAAVFLPQRPEEGTLITLRNPIEIPKNRKHPDAEKVKVEVLGTAAGSMNGPTTGRLFVGPKALEVVESVKTASGGDLRGLVNFGFFGIISRPLFLWLRWTNSWVHNWGWSIIVLTIIINVALLPLRFASMKSALKMQRVQPQITAIKEKYNKFPMRDPRRREMNVEVQALFKREGVNPAGGCLPMIIQLPFLFAFYTMLGVAIELRHANWLWLSDLSAPDPYYIVPAGIVISTFLVQKMTPSPGMDPTQQRMMLFFMPIMLGFISWSLSSGLGLYWVVGNMMAMLMQWWMNRTHLGQEMKAVAAKRARRKGTT